PRTGLRKVLVANRGEIAVRVIRACRDAELSSVAVYADGDRDAPFVTLADEAFALGGATPAESYLDQAKLLDVAARAGADSVHPGYGFLAESADFAQAVIDAGLIWIGPSPKVIRDLGDKVTARQLAGKAGVPLVPGTRDALSGPDEVVAFAAEHGMPVANKAAFGGGGRGLKVARTIEEIPELFDSAVREAVAAFGRGECFVERYLDRPRHVEAQVLADQHGTIVVVGTRDCTLQRRHQKLVEEAPAPFLSSEQRHTIHEAARAICAEAGYTGAGTVEFLVATDGTISFLEVNARLQVEHPVSEETTGVDLVGEQLRIAAGERLSISSDPPSRGHAIEFRINAEDPARGFLPVPGAVTAFDPPSGPGVRLDAGVRTGSVVGGQFDSMLAKLIVAGGNREQALARSRRALAEFVIEGLPTVIPFHRVVVDNPAFAAVDGEHFTVHTRWVETEFAAQLARFQPYGTTGEVPLPPPRQTVVVEVGGRRLEVSLPGDLAMRSGGAIRARPRRRGGARTAALPGDAVVAPMQGTVVKVAVSDGDPVDAGDLIVVLEAMKMENPITAHKAGTITGLMAHTGASVTQGTILCNIT
ncbi:MAG: ATP-grasp domain-containing protein, partial [Actinomycetota bacterium]|nr:ATP-grasp domain-containing protein [Actinomycetota bacterium]